MKNPCGPGASSNSEGVLACRKAQELKVDGKLFSATLSRATTVRLRATPGSHATASAALASPWMLAPSIAANLRLRATPSSHAIAVGVCDVVGTLDGERAVGLLRTVNSASASAIVIVQPAPSKVRMPSSSLAATACVLASAATSACAMMNVLSASSAAPTSTPEPAALMASSAVSTCPKLSGSLAFSAAPVSASELAMPTSVGARKTSSLFVAMPALLAFAVMSASAMCAASAFFLTMSAP